MTATAESIGWGTTVKLHNGSALTELLLVTDVSIPEVTTEEVETTHMKSTGKFRQFIAGLKDAGEFQVTMSLVPGSATDILCRAADAAGDQRAWQITLTDEDSVDTWTIDGTGFAKGYSRTNPLDGKKEAVLTIRVSGALTEATV